MMRSLGMQDWNLSNAPVVSRAQATFRTRGVATSAEGPSKRMAMAVRNGRRMGHGGE